MVRSVRQGGFGKSPNCPTQLITCHINAQFFFDPYKVITSFKRCPLHHSISKLDSYELGVLWADIDGKNLNGTNNSVIEAIAQLDVIISKEFTPFVN